MKLIIDEGILADLSQKITNRREARKKRRQDQLDNAKDYMLYDQMIDVLSEKGYSNQELNLLQRYLLTSNNYDGKKGADIEENMMYDIALNNRLNVDTINYLGKVTTGSEQFTREELNFMASYSKVEPMKALYYAHTLKIPFEEISPNGVRIPTNNIINIINNYNRSKSAKESPMQKKLSFLDVKGYSDASWLTNYDDLDDEVVADAIVALVLGKSKSEVKTALSGLGYSKGKNESWIHEKGELTYKDMQALAKTNPEFAKQLQSHNIYDILQIPKEVPHYTLDQLRNKSRQTIEREIKTALNKKDKQTKADKVNQNEANNNQ